MTRPQRIQLRRAKGWRMPENTVKVDRTTKWGNPYRVIKESGRMWCGHTKSWQPIYSVYIGPTLIARCSSKDEALAISVRRFLGKCHYMPSTIDLAPLRGKNLACWCPLDKPCHADVLLELANAEEPKP